MYDGFPEEYSDTGNLGFDHTKVEVLAPDGTMREVFMFGTFTMEDEEE
jgi:hypothetical protein